MFKFVLALVIASAISFTSFAAEEDRLSYPELEVAPRATERVQMEARKEVRGRWLVHIPIQASALLTLAAANMADKKQNLSSGQSSRFDERVENANYVGAGWLITTTILAAAYKPYTRGFRELKQIQVKDKRDELTRERIAEEVLYRPATVAKAMKWLSVISQAAVSASLMVDADEESAAVAALATIGSFAPVVFNHPWIENAENHKLYKKRIYGPIGGPVLLPQGEAKYTLGYGLQLSF